MKQLSKQNTGAPGKFQKEKTKLETDRMIDQIGEFQNLMYAEKKRALLVVLQGMDASGKDGAIKKVFKSVNPMGCRVYSFKKPTELEMNHDFLWRIHQVVPEKGMFHIFNRSHYEDIVIQRVHKWVDEKTIRQRFDQINSFEKLLTETGTVILKFYLHVSKEEQLQRLNERLKDPSKMWKHNQNDLDERKYWNQYMRAYEDAFSKCSQYVDWHIIPADQNWYKEFLISKKIKETLQALNMKFPGLKKQ